MKVLFIFNHPAPYKVNFFNEISEKIDLTVIFERHANKDRDKAFYDNTFKFKYIFLKGISFGLENHFSTEIVDHLKHNSYDLIVMNGWHTLTEMYTIQFLKKAGINYAFYINGGIKKEKESKLIYKLKRHFIEDAGIYFSPDKTSNQYLLHYGANPNLIINYPYSTIYEADIVKGKINKKELRNKYSLPQDKKLIISCGQFIKRKNYFTLLNQWKRMDEEYHLILIGGGKEKEKYIKFINKNHLEKNVTLFDFMPKSKLFEFFRASDIFVFPSNEDIYGHVINEAMSQGLPVVSSRKVNSSLNLIQDGINGFLYNEKDLNDLVSKIEKTYQNLNELSKNAILTSKKYTIEIMGDFHSKEFEKLYRKPSILYLTTAMERKDYEEFVSSNNLQLNPSNENFHLNLINSLTTKFNVDILSLRPCPRSHKLNLKFTSSFDENKTFYYTENKSSIFYKLFKQNKHLKKNIKKLTNDLNRYIFVDILNKPLLKAAVSLKKKFGYKVFGIVTDNPYNLTNVKKSYCRKIIKYSSLLDGYYCLTEKLNSLVNKTNKPYIVIEGIIQNDFVQKEEKQEKKYFFFAGALYEKYGIRNLVESFINMKNSEVDLIIAGHGPMKEYISEIAKGTRNIKFLGQINKEELDSYEQNAEACINPRPISNLEQESIPSKVIEYVSNKSLVISIKNSLLENIFKDTIIWTDENSLVESMNLVLNDKKIKKSKIAKSYEIAKSKYSYSSIGEQVAHFLENL